jgi:4'-phosphopantetheinyl transferase EntD
MCYSNKVLLEIDTSREEWLELPKLFDGGVFVRATGNLAMSVESQARGSQRGVATVRLQEHAAGRHCAGQALRDAGASDVHVGVASDRRPIWPRGFVGSIAHSRSIACAAVAHCSQRQSLGIDAEPLFDLRAMEDAVPQIVSRDEWCSMPRLDSTTFATIVFSAKESLFKCLYPIVCEFFDFQDASVERVEPDCDGAGRFLVRLRRPLGREFRPDQVFRGRYAVQGGHVHTGVEIAAR